MTYVNAQSKDKKLCRTLVLHYLDVLDMQKPNVVSLPADNFIFEKQVLTNFPKAQIDCLEYNDEVYDIVLQSDVYRSVKHKLTYQKGDIIDHLGMNPGDYDMMWLDLCGPIRKRLFLRMLSIVQHLKRGSYLALTLLQAREQIRSMQSLSDILGFENVNDLRICFIEQMIYSAKQTNRQLTLVESKQYPSDNGSPMVLLIFKTT